MKELEPVSEQTLNLLKTLDTGLSEIQNKQSFRSQYRARMFKDPEIWWSHPAGMVLARVDDQLIRAMEGGVMGAYRELKAEGYAQVALNVIKNHKT